jgi:(1->4)-alpha-D-glucan 1-alpha-D-glucosylmutase
MMSADPEAHRPGSPNGGVGVLLDRVLTHVRSRARLPESTYRWQFHAGFTFRDAQELVDYLHDLGITDCYASPYLKARPGSKHGYDIIDHGALNPEIGTETDYDGWVQALHDHGMGQVLDIVPNHMGIVGNQNAWWNDVLENGPASNYAGYFDIDWHSAKEDLRDRILLAVLGDPYGKALEAPQISLAHENGAFVVHYFEHRFPVAPETALQCLRFRIDELQQVLGADSPEFMEFQSVLTALGHLPPRTETDPGKIAERYRETEVIKRRLATLCDSSAPLREFIERNVIFFNGRRGRPRSFDLLDNLLDAQAYRLAFWRVAADEINYRRFFDINELAALSMEKEEVFTAAHSLVLKLLREGKVTGLRIDHVDGLYDPSQYLQRLQRQYLLGQVQRHMGDFTLQIDNLESINLQSAISNLQLEPNGPSGPPLYVLVEKILGKEEPIPENWPTHGTTGYDFLNMVNGLFVDASQAKSFSRIYQRWTGMESEFADYVYQKKFLTLQVALSSELHMLAHQLDRLSEKNRWWRDFTLNSLRHALRDIIAFFPVYRSYISDQVSLRDHQYVEVAVQRAKRKNPAISSSLFDFVRDMLLLRYPDGASEQDRAEQRRFVGKFQQVTGPVMAKGMEDTAFYIYNRLLSLNEVGGNPGRFGVAPAELHQYFHERRRHWPHALSATATHDTKRGEDVRARLNVLSELPRDWHTCLARWSRWNRRHRSRWEGQEAPDRNDEYFIYQTLLGAWPLPPPHGEPQESLVRRMLQYMEKAVYEAKVHSSWINPNPAYDAAVRHFVTRILDEKFSPRFLQDLQTFQARISHCGLFNSLAQTLLKITAPGVPDIYQGTELWDLSLVDPDNRRPVDYPRRQRLLEEVKTRMTGDAGQLPTLARTLVENKEDGRIKLYVTYQGLCCRRDHPGLFSRGDYLAASAEGSRAENVFAFVRRQEDSWAIAVVPRLITRLVPDVDHLPLGEEAWHDSTLLLPSIRPQQRCRNVFTGEILQPQAHNGKAMLPLAQIFAHFPVALLMAHD